MKELLKYVKEHNFLKMGDYSFSPLMELSAGITLDYCEDLSASKVEKVPLILCFPQKKGAALWSSLIVLTNAFFGDYINNVVDGIQYKVGDKVLIYGCICKIIRISEVTVTLEYKDQTVVLQFKEASFAKRFFTKMSKVSPHRALNKRSKYTAGLKLAKVNRNSVSKILIPNDTDIINQNNLDSKVLLIAGRGNVKEFHKLLTETVLHDEKLSKTFGLEKNLIIKPDLKPYIDCFNQNNTVDYQEFKRSLTKLLEMNIDSIVNVKVCKLLEMLNNQSRISHDFENEFLAFVDDFEDEIVQLRFIVGKFPGVQETVPEKLKAVIINDISQLKEYPETINGFLAQNIPVIIISNRNISNVSEIEFYDSLFTGTPDYYRINWNKSKIQALLVHDAGESFIDSELWEQSKRYAAQQISVKISKGFQLDELNGQLLKEIRELDEFELLQKAYYKYFYPAFYALKNSNKKTPEVSQLILEFKSVLDSLRFSGLNQSTINLFEKGISLANDFDINSKGYNPRDNIFSSKLQVRDMVIPVDKREQNFSSSMTSKLIFTGYPYQEYSGKYLLNSVCVDFIPDIEILCWPHEGALTINYLRRRLLAGYFSDNINNKYNFPSELLIKDKNEFVKEIDSFLSIDSSTPENVDEEKYLNYLHTFKYKGYGASNNVESIFKVNCHVINFLDGSFMFLPKNSKILAETEVSSGSIKISNLKFSDLTNGLRIFKFLKDKSLYKKISLKDKLLREAYDRLDVWREKLNRISEQCDGSPKRITEILSVFKNKMNITNAKPTIVNVRNWLFDEDMIMPDRDNVKLIISTANGVIADNDELDFLEDSYKRVKDHRIHLAHTIKKTIIKHLVKSDDIEEGEIEIVLNGVTISIEVKIIESLDKSDYEIEYQNTRKILC